MQAVAPVASSLPPLARKIRLVIAWGARAAASAWAGGKVVQPATET